MIHEIICPVTGDYVDCEYWEQCGYCPYEYDGNCPLLTEYDDFDDFIDE